MTDFVIAKAESKTVKLSKLLDYAKFLKQPLTLGMFVPCDDYGNILQEPEFDYVFGIDGATDIQIECANNDYRDRITNFQKAQSKVIFEGFKIVEILKDEYTHISDGNVSLFFHNLAEIEVDTNSHNGYVGTPEDFINSNFNFDLVISF